MFARLRSERHAVEEVALGVVEMACVVRVKRSAIVQPTAVPAPAAATETVVKVELPIPHVEPEEKTVRCAQVEGFVPVGTAYV